MNSRFIFFLLSILIFSCTTPVSDSNIWRLESQEVVTVDTTYVLDSIGNLTSEFRVDTISFPIRMNANETWTFQSDDSLLISTTLTDGKVYFLKYEIENTEGGFFLKRNNENQFCKILRKTDEEMILEAKGKIVLKKEKK